MPIYNNFDPEYCYSVVMYIDLNKPKNCFENDLSLKNDIKIDDKPKKWKIVPCIICQNAKLFLGKKKISSKNGEN